MTARDAIVEKGLEGRKEIGEYLNNGFELQATSYKPERDWLELEACSLQLAARY
ncbi:hypothetical protein [Pseudomonas sp. PS02290]|uniref:hypothetical protein n=1 Tax=Pseudomonas sp. PS02290 TaxID=2991430 RepID=UPI00249BE08B|nr:hypothetical protein [Pseudomonas sp. PS02290]